MPLLIGGVAQCVRKERGERSRTPTDTFSSDSSEDEWQIVLSEESEGEEERWAELERRTAEENERRFNRVRNGGEPRRANQIQPVMTMAQPEQMEIECWTIRGSSEEESLGSPGEGVDEPASADKRECEESAPANP